MTIPGLDSSCGCGDPLGGAIGYRLKDNPTFIVRALQMDREFVVPFMGAIVKGIPGEYMVQDPTGRVYRVEKEVFENSYERIT